MKFKLKLFPSGRREWLWMLLQLVLFFLLFFAARVYRDEHARTLAHRTA